MSDVPVIRQVVLDCADARALAEFYREMFDLAYRPGDEPPGPGEPDPRGREWLVLSGSMPLAFQQIDDYSPPQWPTGERPQMLHLDTSVPDAATLRRQRDRAVALGARLLADRGDDPEEPLFVLADPAGHPFCIFVG